MGQCWEKYGTAFGGGVVYPADIVPLTGLINCIVKEWDGSVQTGVPRCVMIYPNSIIETVPYPGGKLNLTFYLTGTPQPPRKYGSYRVQLDDGPVYENLGVYSDGVTLVLYQPDGVATPGQHVVKTWRLDESGQVIPGSALVQGYAVGEAPIEPPPIDPPPIDPPPVEVWNLADVGPPLFGDMNLRVRMGAVEQRTPPMTMAADAPLTSTGIVWMLANDLGKVGPNK